MCRALAHRQAAAGVTSLAALQADDPQRVGPYLLLGRLGSGGMGRVYLARSPGGRQVAVKVIRPQLAEDAGFRARFAREVSAARKVGGLFTAQVVDADLDSPVPWLVTAYVPGASLSEAVKEQGPLPVPTQLALAAGLAEGLNAIHAAGVIHRDLKPSNVLLASDGPRIIDFGISSAVDAVSLTGTGLMIGSPGFMSPEQAEGMPVGPASDIFSLGGMLVFAARGEGPFGGGETAALLYRVVHGTPNLDQIPDGLRPLVSRCLSRGAAARPTAAEFLAELTAAYPSAADLADWLSAGILKLSARRVAEADAYPPSTASGAAAGSAVAGSAVAGSAVAGSAVAGSAVAASAAGAGLALAAVEEAVEPAVDAQPATSQQPGGGVQQPGPDGPQPPDPGREANRWYSQLMQPGPRRRARWPWVVGAVAAACALIVTVVVLSLGSGDHAAAGSSAGAPPSPAASSATPTPTVGSLELNQLRVGDCLTGANMQLNTNDPWPKLTLAVPCNQPHTAEVFFVDNSFWPQNSKFPGSGTISKDGNAACNNAFRSYVGITYSKSIYTWTNIIPDATTWPTGDRALHCVAYYATAQQRAGETLTHSLKSARR
jgi:Protein kinase domain/Septum formation